MPDTDRTIQDRTIKPASPVHPHSMGLRRGLPITAGVSQLAQTARDRVASPQTFGHLIAEIDLSAIRWNIDVLRSFIPPECRFCVAVKANAYGHGLEVVLPTLADAKVDMIAVATVTEARQARELGWLRPILLMGTELSIYHGSLKREVAEWLVRNGIRITLLSPDDLQVVSDAARAVEMPAMIHLKLDSGLSRMGVDETSLLNLIDSLEQDGCVVIDGIYTHFASADDRGCAFAMQQLRRFTQFADSLRSRLPMMPTVHAANSAAIVNMSGSHLDMVRPGIGVYGYQTTPMDQQRIDLRASMRVVSSIMLVKRVSEGSDVGYGRSFRTKRESVLGVIPIGYADGLDRRLSNKGFVTVCGELAPIVGKISMDQTIVDLTDITARHNVQAGSQAVIIDNNPKAPNSVEAMARQLDTIPYEIVTSISPRVTRLAKKP
ncbi:MAG TPA: alanine racemase [Phycisphaerae bacterium]|nr:alanine racemase [Phycisphaerae bacterium]